MAIIQSKEAVLKENLFRLRDLIDQYYVDKGQYPSSLDDARRGRLPAQAARRTRSRGRPTGRPCSPEPDPDRPGEPPGVYDVKSASEALSLSGTPYNEW